MAQIEPRTNKKGEITSYRIRAFCGYGADGKKKSQSMSWKPKEGMTPKQIEKALNKAAAEFEAACMGGKVVNIRKLQNFIEDWFTIHETALTASTIKKYRDCCKRIFPALGHIRIDKIKTADLDKFLVALADERNCNAYGRCKINLKEKLTELNTTQKAFAAKAKVSANCVRSCYNGERIMWDNAVKIAKALKKTPTSVFEKIADDSKLSPKTIRSYHGFLSTVFSYAVKIGEIAVNPCLNCTLPKYEAPDHKILSVAETQRFLQVLDEHAELKYRAFFNIAIYGGFRRGEILALTWDDIDFDNNMVHIRRAVHWSKDKGYYYTDPKTKKSKRSVKMTDRVMLILRQVKNEQLSAKLNYGDYWHNPQRLVFTADDGSTMAMGTPSKFLKKFCEEYDLPRVSVHSMRHLNATLLISKGTNVKTVQSLLGHSTAVTTMSIYAHEIQSAEAAASAALGEILENDLIKKAE